MELMHREKDPLACLSKNLVIPDQITYSAHSDREVDNQIYTVEGQIERPIYARHPLFLSLLPLSLVTSSRPVRRCKVIF